jgi:hypothetical protein
VKRSVSALLVAGSALVGAGVPALGDYWTQYQSRPDAPYPEDQGWQRIIDYGGAQRSIDEDGALVLDSLGSAGIVDYYRVISPGMIHAEPEHPFSMEFRLGVDYANAPEVGVTVWSDDRWDLAIRVSMDRVYSLYEWPMSIPIDPGPHVFRITSSEMRTYVLSIDGVDAMSGSFYYHGGGFTPSTVSWGDDAQGPISLSRWGYVGFGVVPEPISAMCLGLVLVLRSSRRG